MAAGTETTGAEIVESIEHRLPRVPHRERVERIVEGTRRMHGVRPLGMGIGVTLDAVLVAQQFTKR